MHVRAILSDAVLSQTGLSLMLITFGLFALAVVGFGQGSMLHEFVHDGRHALAFPCH